LLNDKLTTTDGAATAGRINVNTAPREVLLAIPQMTEPLAAAILNARGTGRGASNVAERRRTIAWLTSEGILTLRQLRQFAPHLTTQGDVWRGISLGQMPNSPIVVGVEFLLDASVRPAKVRSWRDLPPQRMERNWLQNL